MVNIFSYSDDFSAKLSLPSQGMPDWQEIVQEMPPLEALLSKLER